MSKSSLLCKSLFTAALIATTSLSVPATAQAAYPAYLENDLIKICTAIRDNKPMRLQRIVKKTGLSYRQLQNGLVCNNDDMMTFAAKHQSEATSQLLARRLGTSPTLTAAR